MLGVCLSFGAFYTIGGSKPAMTEWEENYSSGKSRESAEFLVSTLPPPLSLLAPFEFYQLAPVSQHCWFSDKGGEDSSL